MWSRRPRQPHGHHDSQQQRQRGSEPGGRNPCTHKGHYRDYQPAETTGKGAGSGDDGTKCGTEAPGTEGAAQCRCALGEPSVRERGRQQAIVLIRVVSNLLSGYLLLLRQDDPGAIDRWVPVSWDLLRRRVQLV